MLIRPGNNVTIVNPLIVTRVGYPLSFEDGMRHVIERYQVVASELLELARPSRRMRHGQVLGIDLQEDKALAQVMRTMAHEWLKSQGFGGNERKIHTEIDEGLRGRVTSVRRVFTRYTGNRFPGSRHVTYEGEDCSEPPSLENSKAHRIAELTCCRTKDQGQVWSGDPVWVEVCNLKLIDSPARPDRRLRTSFSSSMRPEIKPPASTVVADDE